MACRSAGSHVTGQLQPGNRLGAAITASAAAFNSNMGHISVRVGPAVSFLMTMLNLRLGLWVRHPLAARVGPRRWPGLLFYREMFGLTSASGRIPRRGRTQDRSCATSTCPTAATSRTWRFYELVRRHCRYIIVSDCGADPGVAFDDLGNALRRIREDFGVDISIDVAPLRPDARRHRPRQHVAVGTIHYSATDRGILLYVKPSLTGDEPPDVLQYQTRNSAFPHEATGDQFYDEAQWESYRRLGLHAANRIFHFVAREDDERREVGGLVVRGGEPAVGRNARGPPGSRPRDDPALRRARSRAPAAPGPGPLQGRVPRNALHPRPPSRSVRASRQRKRRSRAGGGRCRHGDGLRALDAAARDAVDGRRVARVSARPLVGPPPESRLDQPLCEVGDEPALPLLVAGAGADVQSRLPAVHPTALPAARRHQRCHGRDSRPTQGLDSSRLPNPGTPDSPRCGGSSARRNRRGGT